MNKTVSVWLPVRNAADLIRRAIESCLRQTYPFVEVVILDDQSTDNTEEVVRGLSAKDSRVKYFKTDSRLGFTRSMAAALEKTSGEFVQLLNHDDWLSENYVEEGIHALSENPDAVVIVPRVIGVWETEGSTRFVGEMGIRPGTYRGKYFGVHSYRTTLPSAMTFGMARRTEALRAARFASEFLANPPESLPQELKELMKYEFGSDILFPAKLISEARTFVASSRMAYLKSDLPLSHYLEHKGSMKLRISFGMVESLATGILKRYQFKRALYGEVFKEGWNTYQSRMRIFFGEEALATIAIGMTKHPWRAFFSGFTLAHFEAFFSGNSPKERFLAVAGMPWRVITRMFLAIGRKCAARPSRWWRKEYFIDEEGKVTLPPR